MQNHSIKKRFVRNLTFFRQLFGCLLLTNICLSSVYGELKDSKSAPTYQVEVIVFEHLASKSGLQEAWPLAPGKPSIYDLTNLTKFGNHNKQDTTELNTPEINSVEFDGVSEPMQINQTTEPAFQLLEAKELQLEDAKARIKATGRYRIIAHKAWRQPIHSKQEAESVRLTAGKTYIQQTPSYAVDLGIDDNEQGAMQSELFEIDGTIKFTRSHYLHVHTDLILTKPMRVLTPASGASSTVKLTNVRNRNRWERESNARLQPFRLKKIIRIRKNEVQYLDHPMFGVLVTVMSVDD